MSARTPSFDEIQQTLKKTAAALNAAGVDYVLAGGVACWARGGAPSATDLDYMVRPAHSERALEALVETGLRADRPPEEWLLKAWDGDVLVDLIFVPTGIAVDDEVFAHGDQVDVAAYEMTVMALEDVLTTQLLSSVEHKLDYETPVQIARSLRDQVDWDELRARTADSPFAKAFFVLVEELGVVPRPKEEAARG